MTDSGAMTASATPSSVEDMNIAGVVLAGGASSRMGGKDKTLIQLGGQQLIKRVADRLDPQVAALAVNSNSDAELLPNLGIPVISDRWPERRGPLAGILAGMNWACSQGFSHIVTVAGDTPFFPTTLVSDLAGTLVGSRSSLVLAASLDDGHRVRRHPTFGIWSCFLASDLASSLERGLRKIVIWSDRHSKQVTCFEAQGFDPFFNINTPEQLEVARTMLAEIEK